MFRRFCCLSALVSVVATCSAQTSTGNVLERTSRSVVVVMCGVHRNGTGFLWKRRDQVLTALHVVAGCDSLYVRFESLRTTSRATIARALRDADLAMLNIEDPQALPPLEAASARPALDDDLIALGYSLGAQSMGSTNLRLSFGSTLLADILPFASRQQVEAAGMPSLSLHIVRLQGHLVPGLSGAPILNARGNVVAIGDGVLESGAAAIS